MDNENMCSYLVYICRTKNATGETDFCVDTLIIV